jgi:serine/threonine protein kinase
MVAHRYLKEGDAAKLFSQLISGVWYIHQKKIAHRDLKLENLLLDRHRNVIITDFGFANRMDDLMQGSCGSPCYAAPELFSKEPYVGSAADIWSCGVTLYATLVGYLPFHDDPANPNGDNLDLLYEHIVNKPLYFPDYISTDARDLLSMMLIPDPAHRATLVSVMAHPWLAPYGQLFQRTVDELENAAMEQQQMKRLAYQRQMKAQAAAGTRVDAPGKLTRRESKDDAGRTRKDPPPSTPSAPEKKTVDTGRDAIQAEADDTSYPETAPSTQMRPSAASTMTKPLPSPLISAEANTRPTGTRPAIHSPQADSQTPVEQQPGSSPNNSTASSSRHKGLSMDKMALTKIFGITSTAEPVEDGGNQCQSQSHSPTMLQSLRCTISGAGKTTSKNSMLSPLGESGTVGEDAKDWKKCRRNTLMTMTGPLRSRTRKSKTPTPARESFEKPIAATATATATPPPAPPQNASIGDFGMGSIGMQASTDKARTVMHWFRARNQSQDPIDFALSAPDGRYAKIGPNMAFTLPHKIFPSFRRKWTSGSFVMPPNCHHHRIKNVNPSSILPGAFRICFVLFSAASSSMKLASWL